MSSAIDFVGLARALLQRADELVREWLPNGVERNGRWYIGDFDGNEGESANVNLATGQWIDNGAPDTDVGRDLISLYARVFRLDGNAAAARELIERFHWEREYLREEQHAGGRQAQGAPAEAAPPPAEPPAGVQADRAEDAKARERWVSMLPVPRHAKRPTEFKHGFKNRHTGQWEEFTATKVWPYEFEGELQGFVARFERVNSKGQLVKDTVPLTWCEDTWDPRRGARWHWKQWPEPRPLYVPATVLSEHPRDVPVVVVEGEKCAEAGFQLLGHEFDFISWPGGCKAWAKARWSTVMGRNVILFPDHDAKRQPLTRAEREAGVSEESKPILPLAKQPGYQAMVGIGQLLQAEHGCTVTIVAMPAPGDKPDGWDLADAVAEGWGPEKVRDYLRASTAFVGPDDAQRAKVAATPQAAGASEEPVVDAWRSKLVLSAQGSIKAVRENVVLALDGLPDERLAGIPEAHGVVAFNDFTNDVVKLKDAPWGTPAGVWDEVDELELGNWLVRQHWLPSMPRGTLEEAVAMVAKRHRFHPVRQQLDALRGKWDGVKRLSTWLARACLEEDEWDDRDPLQQYLARVGTWLLMAICARVLTPGCKFDYMVIFEGAQGVGKSTLARILGGDYFADTGLVLGDKDSYQNLQGVLIYEWGELDSLTKAEVTKVKQFISSMKDRFRASFDRRAKDYPRQVVFIGTTNEDHYLVDPTGNRRMWPVRVTRPIDLAWVREHRDQLFAEALHYVLAGERFHPTTREQRELFDPQQQQRQIENAIQTDVVRYLYDPDQRVGMHGENGTLVAEISAPELLGRLGISVDKRTNVLLRQATAALRQCGWVRGRRNKPPRDWVFRRPNPDPGPNAGASDVPPRPVQGASDSEDLNAPPF